MWPITTTGWVFKKMLACSVSLRVIVIAWFSYLCLKDQLGLCSLNCRTHTMTGNCSASQRVLANSLRVVSAKRGNPPLYGRLYCLAYHTVLQKYAHIGLNLKQNLPTSTSLPNCLTMLPLFVFTWWEDFLKISPKCVHWQTSRGFQLQVEWIREAEGRSEQRALQRQSQALMQTWHPHRAFVGIRLPQSDSRITVFPGGNRKTHYCHPQVIPWAES